MTTDSDDWSPRGDETHWGKPTTDDERQLVEAQQERALWAAITGHV